MLFRSLYYISRDDPRGPVPDKPENDSQFKNWEKAVADWYSKQKGVITDQAPTKDCQADDFKGYNPNVSLTIPSSTSSASLTLSVNADAPYGVDKVTYSVDGTEVGTVSSSPYSLSYTIPAGKNNSTLKIEVELRDQNGNTVNDSKLVSAAF